MWMKVFVWLSVLVWFGSVNAEQSISSVTIELSGLESREGVVFVGLCTEAEYETFDCNNAMLKPDPDGVRHTFSDIAPGIYGVTVLHDANENGRMDFNFFGAPKEQWGASNNPPPRMGRSKWADVAFEVGAQPITLNIRMQ